MRNLASSRASSGPLSMCQAWAGSVPVRNLWAMLHGRVCPKASSSWWVSSPPGNGGVFIRHTLPLSESSFLRGNRTVRRRFGGVPVP